MICRPPRPAPTPDPIQPGKFVIVNCLGNLIQVPHIAGQKRYRWPIEEDVSVGQRYQVKATSGNDVTIKTPGGKHKKEYTVPLSCVSPAPN
jgi:hypothetical protein